MMTKLKKHSMKTLMTMHDYNDNEGDDLYIILMRLFVCLSVTFCHHADCWCGVSSGSGLDRKTVAYSSWIESSKKNNLKIIYAFKMNPTQTVVRPNDPIKRMTNDWWQMIMTKQVRSNPSWVLEARSETLRTPQNVPARTVSWPEDPV